jgi:hypothetical protein
VAWCGMAPGVSVLSFGCNPGTEPVTVLSAEVTIRSEFEGFLWII